MKGKIGLEDFIAYSQGKKKIILSRKDKARVEKSRAVLEALMQGYQIYGVNTGVGSLLERKVAPQEQEAFQRELIQTHAAGSGSILDLESSRGILFLLINMLRKGYSGISLETLQFLIDLFNQDMIPVILEQGSLGASGDLIPLAHLALCFIEEGQIYYQDSISNTSELFARKNIIPPKLKAGEALSLINGTHFMTALLALSVHQAEILVKSADAAAWMTINFLKGNPEAFNEEIHKLRPHPGQLFSSQNIRAQFEKEPLSYQLDSLQDNYSLRCSSQVHGAVREAVSFAKNIVEREINSVTGNPIILADNSSILHGGNFHGQPLALAADILSIGLATLANISERRIDKLVKSIVDKSFAVISRGEFLRNQLMMAQYLAASLVAENKGLSHPASVDSIPVACGQEDFVSMGGWAVRKAKKIADSTAKVLAVEIMSVNLSLNEMRWPHYYSLQHSTFEHIEKVFRSVKTGNFLASVEKELGAKFK